MAVDEQSKTDFNSILTSLERKFDVIHMKWSEKKFFEAKFRTHIQRNSDDYNALCDEWVDLFSNATSTVWVKKISNTGPKIRFRKQYQCWPQIGKEVQKELLFDARRCKATLDIKVLTDNPLTRRKNKHIRMGLNVVVKMNFTHLHSVETTTPYAFFIHTCEPQPEPPKPIIHSNEKLSQKVAEMVQKGLNASPKVVNPNAISSECKSLHTANKIDITAPQIEQPTTDTLLQQQEEVQVQLQLQQQQQQIQQQQLQLQQNQLPIVNMESVALNHVLPLQNTADIKLQVQPQLSQLTQVVVSAPSLEMSEPLLMCQPTLMFDPTQVIPVTAHHLPPHFVQVHSHNITNQHGHYI